MNVIFTISFIIFCLADRPTIQNTTVDKVITYYTTVDLNFNHSDLTLNFSIICEKSEFSIDENWGFRELQLISFMCYNSCLTCDGPEYTNCLSCNSSLGYYFFENECVTECPSNYDQNPETSLCESIVTCNSEESLYNAECVTECPSHYYSHFDTEIFMNKCDLCNNNCSNCSGSLETECLTCNEENYYFSNKKCLKCDPSCKKCSGPLATECDECTNVSLTLVNNECTAEIPEGYYLDSNNTCQTCDRTCKTCSGDSPYECLTCVRTLVLTLNSACQIECDSGSYDLKKICQACDDNCLNCSGPNSTNCTACYLGYLLDNSSCLEKPKIDVNYIEITNPETFGIYFNDSISEHLEILSSLIEVTISDYDADNYKVSYKVSSSNSSMILLSITFYTNFTGTDKTLAITMNSLTLENSADYPYFLLTKNTTFPMKNFTICEKKDHYFSDGTHNLYYIHKKTFIIF